MLSAVLTALLFVVMLLIVTSLILGAWRAYRRHKQQLATQPGLPAHPLDRHVTAILHLQDGVVVSVEKAKPTPSFTLPSSWYSRRRTLVSLGFLVMLLLALFTQGGLAGGSVLTLSKGLSLSFLTYNNNPTDLQTSAHPVPPVPQTASTLLVRVDSGARNQYSSPAQYYWAYSSCSGIAMEMVMNAYGRHLIASDVLQKELDLGVWSSSVGLLREEGIAMTAATFGFNTDAGHTRSLQAMIDIANKGKPLIVGVRDSYYYPNGHLMVVRGGDSQYVYLADSSPANFPRMTRAMFSGMWNGFSAILTPR